MLRRILLHASPRPIRPVCLLCAARAAVPPPQARSFGATAPLLKRKKKVLKVAAKSAKARGKAGDGHDVAAKAPSKPAKGRKQLKIKKHFSTNKNVSETGGTPIRKIVSKTASKTAGQPGTLDEGKTIEEHFKSLKSALLTDEGLEGASKSERKKRKKREAQLEIQLIDPDVLQFDAVEVDKPPVPMLSYGLDRVLFNPGVYRLQDPRSRIYNFDPYLERIMPVHEFDFDALSEYKTSSKDQDLLSLTKACGTRFTGSTSSMSSVLQHFHYLLSSFRDLNHSMLSREFPEPSKRFSKITLGPDAIFLRYKNGIYAIDADKSFDSPNIMSWLGHSLEKLLTSDRSEFETYRRSSPEKASPEDNASRCYHYSKQGNILMRSQLDAQDPRLPGTGVFDLKTRAVVSIRMNHKEYESGSGYQLRKAQGEWESFEREFYDMTRATMLKYSLQVRMGRMDGIFLAYHNIERIFGFQYLSLSDMDRVLHGQEDTHLGDHEFKISINLLDELLSKATAEFPETTLRMHFEARDAKTPFMYIFAEPVTEEQADEIQNTGEAAQKDFARTVVGVGKDDPEVQAEWQTIQDEVDEQVDDDKEGKLSSKETEEGVEEGFDEGVEEGVEEEAVDESSTATKGVEDQKATTAAAEDAATTDAEPDGPLMGWTLTVRNKINGGYVDRPQSITKEDDWQVEYHIQEIPKPSRRRLYNAVKDRRRNLIGLEDQEADKALSNYRDLIQRFSNRGRQWREEQDKINEEMGRHVYRRMGPGSEALSSNSAAEKTQ